MRFSLPPLPGGFFPPSATGTPSPDEGIPLHTVGIPPLRGEKHPRPMVTPPLLPMKPLPHLVIFLLVGTTLMCRSVYLVNCVIESCSYNFLSNDPITTTTSTTTITTTAPTTMPTSRTCHYPHLCLIAGLVDCTDNPLFDHSSAV